MCMCFFITMTAPQHRSEFEPDADDRFAPAAGESAVRELPVGAGQFRIGARERVSAAPPLPPTSVPPVQPSVCRPEPRPQPTQ